MQIRYMDGWFDGVAIQVTEGFDALRNRINTGDAVVLKGVFSRHATDAIVDACANQFRTEESQLLPFGVGQKNHNRIDDEPPKAAKKRRCRLQSISFCNEHCLNEKEVVYALAALRNELSGLPPKFAMIEPEDGHICLGAVYRYPSGGGYVEVHTDPMDLQKTVAILAMAERGVDFQEGGLFAVDPETGEQVDLEPHISAGDIVLCLPDIPHGVAPIDPRDELDWTGANGRWMMITTISPVALYR